VLLTKHYYTDEIKENDMGQPHCKYGKMKNAFKFLSQNRKGRDQLGDICTDGRTILIWILKN
jgi:hypothetical protein